MTKATQCWSSSHIRLCTHHQTVQCPACSSHCRLFWSLCQDWVYSWSSVLFGLPVAVIRSFSWGTVSCSTFGWHWGLRCVLLSYFFPQERSNVTQDYCRAKVCLEPLTLLPLFPKLWDFKPVPKYPDSHGPFKTTRPLKPWFPWVTLDHK